MKLSVILPTIRPELLIRWYNSFIQSYTGEFELIIISPNFVSDFIGIHPNLKYIQDWGSPLRCQQLGLTKAEGDYIHRAVDDSIYIREYMSKEMQKIKDYKDVINLKFIEGESQTHRDMSNPDFYNMEYHIQTLAAYTPFDYKVINFSIISRQFLNELGGWDASIFETIGIGELDLSLRMQFMGANVILSDNVVIKCDWQPGETGDHASMHQAFPFDMDKYRKIYSTLEYEDRLIIPIDNWKKAPEKWERRFQ